MATQSHEDAYLYHECHFSWHLDEKIIKNQKNQCIYYKMWH